MKKFKQYNLEQIALFDMEIGDYSCFYTPEGYCLSVSKFLAMRFDLSKMEMREFVIGWSDEDLKTFDDTNMPKKVEDILDGDEWYALHNYPYHMGFDKEDCMRRYKTAFDKLWQFCDEPGFAG